MLILHKVSISFNISTYIPVSGNFNSNNNIILNTLKSI